HQGPKAMAKRTPVRIQAEANRTPCPARTPDLGRFQRPDRESGAISLAEVLCGNDQGGGLRTETAESFIARPAGFHVPDRLIKTLTGLVRCALALVDHGQEELLVGIDEVAELPGPLQGG